MRESNLMKSLSLFALSWILYNQWLVARAAPPTPKGEF